VWAGQQRKEQLASELKDESRLCIAKPQKETLDGFCGRGCLLSPELLILFLAREAAVRPYYTYKVVLIFFFFEKRKSFL
jgi:hypothetical protein